MSIRRSLLVCLAAVALLNPTPSRAASILTDTIDIKYLASGFLFADVAWPGHAFGVTVGANVEYDYFGLGVAKLDVSASSIRFFIPSSSIGWADLGGFTGLEISGIDWPDAPGTTIGSIAVTILNPGLVNQEQGVVPYSADLVTFGPDFVRIPTGGYDMFAGFEVLVDLTPVPEPSAVALVGLGLLGVVRHRALSKRRGR